MLLLCRPANGVSTGQRELARQRGWEGGEAFSRQHRREEKLQEKGMKVIIKKGLRNTGSDRGVLITIVSLKNNETSAMADIYLRDSRKKLTAKCLLHPLTYEIRLQFLSV